MILYHGSYTVVDKPNISYSRDNVDFGKGFYTIPIKEQAEKWSKRFLRKKQKAFISQYCFDEDNDLKVLKFDAYDENWLNFILICRKGQDTSDYDVVIGGVANDKVFNTVELYFDGLIDKKEAIKRLIYEKPNMQVCFRTQKALEKLKFEGSEEYVG